MCVEVKDDGHVIYRPSEMEEGKIYPFEAWGGHYALRKNEKFMEFLEFKPDNIFWRTISKIKRWIS